MAIRIEKRQY